MTRPSITAEHEVAEIRTMQGQLSPAVLVTVTYEHGREHEALTVLDRAVIDVANQIRSTNPELSPTGCTQCSCTAFTTPHFSGQGQHCAWCGHQFIDHDAPAQPMPGEDQP